MQIQDHCYSLFAGMQENIWNPFGKNLLRLHIVVFAW